MAIGFGTIRSFVRGECLCPDANGGSGSQRDVSPSFVDPLKMEVKKEVEMMLAQVDTREIGEKGRALFGKISPELEKDHWGKFMVIEVDSGAYFIGDTIIDADEKAKERYSDKVFFLGKIGYRAATSFKGR